MVVMSCEVWGDKIRELLFGDAVTASREISVAGENISVAYEGVKGFLVLCEVTRMSYINVYYLNLFASYY